VRELVWLDADPGFDDWMTMLMLADLHQTGRIHWIGTSIVHGNAPLAVTMSNAQAIAEYYQLPGILACGHETNLAITAQSILGENGMRTTGAILPSAIKQCSNLNAVDALKQQLQATDQAITLIATGPLTNIAALLESSPATKTKIKKIVLMGGSTDRGNHTAAAEFNIYANPEAASVVFNAGVPITMFGLNLCRQVLLTQEDVAKFRGLPSVQAHCFTGYLDAYQRIRSADGAQAMPIYDPVVAAYLAAPDQFVFQSAKVDVECEGRFTRGMTVCDFKVTTGAKAQVAMCCNGEVVKQIIFESVARYLASLDSLNR
jgi:purine nucleosidase